MKQKSTLSISIKQNYFSNPNRYSKYKNGSPKSFQALFVFKESNGSVLLGGNDILDGSMKTNKSKIYGWISNADKTDWNTRLALENAQSDDAKVSYGDAELYGYPTLKQLKTCLDGTVIQKCSNPV